MREMERLSVAKKWHCHSQTTIQSSCWLRTITLKAGLQFSPLCSGDIDWPIPNDPGLMTQDYCLVSRSELRRGCLAFPCNQLWPARLFRTAPKLTQLCHQSCHRRYAALVMWLEPTSWPHISDLRKNWQMLFFLHFVTFKGPSGFWPVDVVTSCLEAKAWRSSLFFIILS